MNHDGPDFRMLRDTWRRASKDHKCSWCDTPIAKGMRYASIAYIEDGRFKHDKLHLSHLYGGG